MVRGHQVRALQVMAGHKGDTILSSISRYYLILTMISCTDSRSLVMSCSLSWLMRSSVSEVRDCFFILISMSCD